MTTGERILDFLREKPGATVREVGKAVGFSSPGSVHYQLKQLEKKGLLRRVACSLCGAQVRVVIDQEETAWEEHHHQK